MADKSDVQNERNCDNCDKAWTDYCEREACYKNGYCKWVAELDWDEIERKENHKK